MHELGIVIQVVKQMEDYMEENKIDAIDKLVLQIGALSSVYPKYIEDVYPIAVEKSRLKSTVLEIEVTPGIGRCMSCAFAYDLIENKNICPRCKTSDLKSSRARSFLLRKFIFLMEAAKRLFQ